MDVQLKCSIFNRSDAISIPAFIHNFRTVCDSNRVYGAVAMWLFLHIMKERNKAALSDRIRAAEDNKIDKEGTLKTYC